MFNLLDIDMFFPYLLSLKPSNQAINIAHLIDQ